MAPLTPFDRDEWTERHPTSRNSCCGKRVCICPVDDHGVSIAGRIVLAGVIAICCAAVITVVIATVEIAADWVRAS